MKSLTKSKIFIGLAISFAAGIWLASRFTISRVDVLIGLAVTVVIFSLSFNNVKRTVPLAALFLFVAGLGILRLQVTMVPSEYQTLFDTKQQLEGYIVEDPDVRLTNQFLTIEPKGYRQRILVTTRLADDYSYGQWVLLEGKIQQPENFDDFDYQKYLERFDVYAVMKYPSVIVLRDHQQNFIKEKLLKIKHAFAERVGKLLPEPRSSLLMGILIGARKTLPEDITNNFNATGVSHIVSISGYNISIIVGWLGFLAYWFGRRARFWVTLTIIAGFVILAGASASVIRAAIMGGMVLLAMNIGRLYSVGPALFFAATCMLVVNPKILYWDTGFQLSFLATLGIVYFVPLLEQLTEGWPDDFKIKSLLLTTLSAIAATLPLILFTFGRLSVVAPLVNILVLPIVPLAMLLGFLSVLPWVGIGCAFAADIILRYILRITEIFARVPYGSISMKISQWIFLILSLVIIGVYILLRRWVVTRSSPPGTGGVPSRSEGEVVES